MKKKKNHTSRIMAAIALFAIIVGIVGTWVLVLVQILSTPSEPQQSYTQEQLQELIDSYSGSETQVLSGETVKSQK